MAAILFLVELARDDGGDLPDSIVESVARRTERTGAAEGTLRTAAVLGPRIDLDLLDDSISLDPTPDGFVARAPCPPDPGRVRGRGRGCRACDAGAAALEIAGWAVYYRRDFPRARAFAERAASAAVAGDPIRARALALR